MKLAACALLTVLTASFTSSTYAEALTSQQLELVKQAEQARIDAIASVYGSVVAVYGPTRQGGGSGVVFDPGGYALTNHHVVAGAGTNGQGGLADTKLYPWKMVGTDPGGDVAIIKLESKEAFPYSPLGISDHVRVGDWAMAMGNPFLLAEDQKPTVTLGVVSGVKRYQYGAGRNTLVYGNCIQVDSSINPGNSGGPLFNMQGQVIGINGRGSFKERGRVNVGVGYAISMKQIRNFIPDLMATKMAQHGTLDALFSNRRDEKGQEVVLCDTLNLDAPVARLGLGLGDRLLAFEGEVISDANQFTNLVSTLPADWPCELKFEHEGKEKTIFVRLTALPYGQEQIHPPPEDEEKPAEEPKGEDKDDKKPQPRKIEIGRAKPNFGAEGQIRDLAFNRENAKYILSRWRHFSGVQDIDEKVQALEIRDELLRKDKRIGEVTTVLAKDGRFRVSYEEYGVAYDFGFDGKDYWVHLPDREAELTDAAELLAHPLAAQGLMLANMLRDKPLENLGEAQIDGSDKARRRPCYRIRVTQDDAPLCYAWLQQFNDQGQHHVQLAKSGTDIDGANVSIVYSDWRPAAGVWLPHTRALATGLDEASVVSLKAAEIKPIAELDEKLLRSPVNVETE